MEIEKIRTNKSIESSIVVKAKQAKTDSVPERGFEQHALIVGLYLHYQQLVNEGMVDYQLPKIKKPVFTITDEFQQTLKAAQGEKSDPKPNLAHAGKLLANYRERTGLNRSQLALVVGLDPSHLFRLEHGERRIGLHSLPLLVQALDLSDQEFNELTEAFGLSKPSLDLSKARMAQAPVTLRKEPIVSIKQRILEKINRDELVRLYRQELYGRRLLDHYQDWVEVGLEDFK